MSVDGAMNAFRGSLTTTLKELGMHLCCSVCLELPQRPVKLACSHYFCAPCSRRVFEAAKPTCPTCRQPCTKRESREDERFASIVHSFTNVLAAVAGAVEAEVPFGSQIPKEQLEAHNAGAQRRTSISRVKEIRATMPLNAAAMREAVAMMWGEETRELGPSEVPADAPTTSCAHMPGGAPKRTAWTGPLIDPAAEVIGDPCAFCKRGSEVGESVDAYEEKVKGKKTVARVHRTCAMWAPKVFDSNAVASLTHMCGSSLINVCKEVDRAKHLRCFVCKKTGAPMGCFDSKCKKSFHIWCARSLQGMTFDEDGFSLMCPTHSETIAISPPKRPATSPLMPSSKHRRMGSVGPSDVNYETLSLTKPHIVGSFLSTEEKNALMKFCEKFDCEFEATMSGQTTHVVMSNTKVDADRRVKKRSDKFFDGLRKGCWIVGASWIRTSLKKNRRVDEAEHEIMGDTQGNDGGPRRSRLNKGVKIFSGWHFVFYGAFANEEKVSTCSQFASCDGATVSKIEDAESIVIDPALRDASRVVIVVDKPTMKKTSQAVAAQFANELIPFAKRLPKPAEAVVFEDYVINSVCRREAMNFGENSLRALERAHARLTAPSATDSEQMSPLSYLC